MVAKGQKYKHPYNPTPAEIREKCKEIQATWNDWEEKRRRRWAYKLFSVPSTRVIGNNRKERGSIE